MHGNLNVKLEQVKSKEVTLKALVAQAEKFASAWEERSEQACRLGEEDLAREALARRSKYLRERQGFLVQLSQVEMLRGQLEKELEDAVKEDSKNTVRRVAEEIKVVQQELKRAREAENALLASILEERINILLDLGRQAWKAAFPDETSCQTPPLERDVESFSSPFVDPYSREIDVELENLKRRLDEL